MASLTRPIAVCDMLGNGQAICAALNRYASNRCTYGPWFWFENIGPEVVPGVVHNGYSGLVIIPRCEYTGGPPDPRGFLSDFANLTKILLCTNQERFRGPVVFLVDFALIRKDGRTGFFEGDEDPTIKELEGPDELIFRCGSCERAWQVVKKTFGPPLSMDNMPRRAQTRMTLRWGPKSLTALLKNPGHILSLENMSKESFGRFFTDVRDACVESLGIREGRGKDPVVVTEFRDVVRSLEAHWDARAASGTMTFTFRGECIDSLKFRQILLPVAEKVGPLTI